MYIHFHTDGGELGGLLLIFWLAAWTARMYIRLDPYPGQPGPLACHDPELRHRHDQHFLQLANIAYIISIREFIVCTHFSKR